MPRNIDLPGYGDVTNPFDTPTCRCGEEVSQRGDRCEECQEAYEAAMDDKIDQMRDEEMFDED